MPESVLLSVVVPVYNGEKFMEGCLRSLEAAVNALAPSERAQVEIVVCDNHSQDRTLEMAEAAKIACTLRLVLPPEHYANRTRNWHHGLCEARGTWMMMLHADDRMAPTGLAAILNACRAQTATPTVMLSGKHRVFRDDTPPGPLKPRWNLPSLIGGEALRRTVLSYFCPFVPFTVMRRETYRQVGGLDLRYELVQDWDLWIRLLAHGPLAYVPQEFGHWRAHDFSPHYATVFGREHFALVSTIRDLIPGLSPRQADDALDRQLPRVMHWLPDTPLETLTADLPERDRILSRPRPKPEEIPAALKRIHRLVGVQMNRLRILGSVLPARSGGTSAEAARQAEARPE